MFTVPVLDALAGTTIRLTWVNSGAAASPISFALLDRNETLISSIAGVSSGNGHYYAPVFVPNSFPYYVAQAIAVVDASTYVSRALVKRWKVEAN